MNPRILIHQIWSPLSYSTLDNTLAQIFFPGVLNEVSPLLQKAHEMYSVSGRVRPLVAHAQQPALSDESI